MIRILRTAAQGCLATLTPTLTRHSSSMRGFFGIALLCNVAGVMVAETCDLGVDEIGPNYAVFFTRLQRLTGNIYPLSIIGSSFVLGLHPFVALSTNSFSSWEGFQRLRS